MPLQGAGVVGAPARTDASLSWLLADHTGVLRSTDAGATWTSVHAAGIALDADHARVRPLAGPGHHRRRLAARQLARRRDVGAVDGPASVPTRRHRSRRIGCRHHRLDVDVRPSRATAAADAVLRLADTAPDGQRTAGMHVGGEALQVLDRRRQPLVGVRRLARR